MGVVYRARQIALDRTVALKLITPEMVADGDFRERMQRESKLLASIDHPNVIPVYEAGEVEGQLFMSMRYVEGLDLYSLIAAEGPLAPERAARIVSQVAAGLDAAHARGLVHRDVKPANVLIEYRDGGEHAYLGDFGLAKRVNPTTAITRGGQWVGTLDYVAPEQIEGRQVDARTDVYSLGCVLFQALTGRAPFVRDLDVAKLYAHLNDPAPSARQLRPELPVELDDVCARAMAKEPAQRYQSAGDLGRATIAAAGGEAFTEAGHDVATGAPAVPAGPRLPRRRALLAAGAVSSALLLAAAGTAVLSGAGDDDAPSNADSTQIVTVTTSTEATPATASDPPATSSRSGGAAAPPPASPTERTPALPPPPATRGSSTPRSTSPTAKSTTRTRPRSNPSPKRRPPAKIVPPAVTPPAAAPPPPPPPPAALPLPVVPPPPPSGPRRAACSDGHDNDGDGKTDFPADLGCTSAADMTEKAACSDGVDNDGDGKTDFPADPECSSNDDPAEKV